MPFTPSELHPGHSPEPLDVPLKLWLARLANGISPASVMLAYADWFSHLLTSPSRQADLAGSAMRKSLQWTQYAAQAWRGDSPLSMPPEANDKRFAPNEWHRPPFNLLAQGFLLNEQWWNEAMTGVRGVSKHHEDLAAFTTRQWLDMWSPSNFVATNPQVIKETAIRGAANLAEGAVNWWRDAVSVATDGRPRGVEAFEPGKGVALTPGKVVYRNALIELIQYEPATAQVMAEPVLIIPSWIMKYYILDLTPDDSVVKYLVGKGHTVFMVSWKNPDSADRDLGLNDYLSLGVMNAVDAVRRIRPGVRIHAAGYCLGGTLLAMAAAALAGETRNPLKTVSLLAAEVDFYQPGELGLFIDESQIAFLEGLMAERGYLDGRQMAGAFQLINSKDLVWSKLVHEYLMGAQTPMTAMRAWNADATRLPARMHSEYLRKLYLHNDLAEGRYCVGKSPVRLDAIKQPLFVVATDHDHVSPWKSVYQIHELTHTPISFALSSGGHNVGIVSPPAGPLAYPKATYRFAASLPGKAPGDPQDWLDHAERRQGSWWTGWQQWLAGHSTGRAKARPVAGLVIRGEALAAPGTFVFQR